MLLTSQGHLTLKQLYKVYRQTLPITIEKKSLNALAKDANWLAKKAKEGKPIYGVNTGFGKLANVAIPEAEWALLQNNLLLSHATGMGPLLPDAIVRLILLLKINGLIQGYSGVRPVLIEYLLAFYQAELWPCVPSKGSVGASGDLAPLSHLALPLLGFGFCHLQGKKISGQHALDILNLPPLTLSPKEGLALINGTQVSTALALAGLFAIQHCFDVAVQAGLLTLIASGGHADIFDERMHKLRRQTGQILVAKQYRDLLANSTYAINPNRVQDPYCLRCQPQVMGACLDQLRFAEKILSKEACAVTDNPLLFRNENCILSGGNFHAEPVAFTADQLALVVAEIGAISERRIAFLMDHTLSGLPAFLSKNPGLNSGLMNTQVTAAALASENKSLAHPAVVDSIPTSANQEDHVSMATFVARRLQEMADNTAGIVAIELIAACQALDLRSGWSLSTPLQTTYEKVRQVHPFIKVDADLSIALQTLQAQILSIGSR